MNFQKKGSKQSKGHFAYGKSQQSIFKSPDTVDGRVGVVGSGQAMTSYAAQKTKYSEHFKSTMERAQPEQPSMSAKRPKKY